MLNNSDERILDVLLDSWDRNNKILINLLRAIPKEGLEAKVMMSSPSVAQLFTHIHFVRLVFISEDAPEFARELPCEEWAIETDHSRIEDMLNESASAVREVVKSTVGAERALQVHYDHPILFLQHMLWHEGYHHGQIKLALKSAGFPLSDEQAGPLTWNIWMDKNSTPLAH
jgi:uncharacterized damage-inducible protein DinB